MTDNDKLSVCSYNIVHEDHPDWTLRVEATSNESQSEAYSAKVDYEKHHMCNGFAFGETANDAIRGAFADCEWKESELDYMPNLPKIDIPDATLFTGHMQREFIVPPRKVVVGLSSWY